LGYFVSLLCTSTPEISAVVITAVLNLLCAFSPTLGEFTYNGYDLTWIASASYPRWSFEGLLVAELLPARNIGLFNVSYHAILQQFSFEEAIDDPEGTILRCSNNLVVNGLMFLLATLGMLLIENSSKNTWQEIKRVAFPFVVACGAVLLVSVFIFLLYAFVV
jgi:hypothetical protein